VLLAADAGDLLDQRLDVHALSSLDGHPPQDDAWRRGARPDLPYRGSPRIVTSPMFTLGIALLVAALALFVAEAHVPTGGVLGAGGVVALVAGAWIALVAAGAGLLVAVPVTVGTGLVSATVLVLVASKTVRAMRLPTSSGSESLVGRTGEVRAELEAGGAPGQVFVDGALWRAEPADEYEEREALRTGDRVVVERVRGLTLGVRKAEEWELEA